MPRTARYPQRLLPPRATRADWREAGRTHSTAGGGSAKAAAGAARAYEQKWTAVWKVTLDLAREIEEWEDAHLWLIADYVDARRLAFEHQRAADEDGRYSTNHTGRTYAHPGIDKARDARRESRDIAAELGITPKAMRDAGLLEDPEDDEPQGDQAGL